MILSDFGRVKFHYKGSTYTSPYDFSDKEVVDIAYDFLNG